MSALRTCDCGDTRLGASERGYAETRSEDDADPEREITRENGNVRRPGERALESNAACPTAAAKLPNPQHQQQSGQDEQPQIQRLRESKTAEIDVWNHFTLYV